MLGRWRRLGFSRGNEVVLALHERDYIGYSGFVSRLMADEAVTSKAHP